MSTYIYPYNSNSESVARLANLMEARRIRLQQSRYRARRNHRIINWGNPNTPDWMLGENCPNSIYNHPANIRNASNKLIFMRILLNYGGGFNLDYWTSPGLIPGNIRENNDIVVRHRLNGHSGEGIEIVHPGEGLPDAPLYVRYYPKISEWRLHVVGGRVIFVQKKMGRQAARDDEVNWQIRTHNNGFIYAHNPDNLGGEWVPEVVCRGVVAIVGRCGLEFGAVDVMYNQHHDQWKFLEVNTAPGLSDTTAQAYAENLIPITGEGSGDGYV